MAIWAEVRYNQPLHLLTGLGEKKGLLMDAIPTIGKIPLVDEACLTHAAHRCGRHVALIGGAVKSS